jgi:hypothetical protein
VGQPNDPSDRSTGNEPLPSYEPPSSEPPSYEPPSYEPPSYEPPSYEQPTQGLPTYGAPAYQQPGYQPTQDLPSYGHPDSGQAGYGQPSSDQPNYAYGYGPPAQAQFGYPPPGYAPRPSAGTVITAGVVQIVQASLVILVGLLVLFVADTVQSIVNEAEKQTGSDVDSGRITGPIIAVGLVIVAIGVLLIVLAALAMRGRRWAAVTSVVLQSLAALLFLIGLVDNASNNRGWGGSFVALATSVTVIVFFLVAPSNRFFAASGQRY